jgi:hypothetical protein
MMGKVKEVAGDADIMLVSGDYTAHDISAKREVADPKYSLLRSAITACFAQYIDPFFVNTTILAAIGNNDVEFHYEYPRTHKSSDYYYSFLYNLWWNDLETNSKYSKKEEIKETMMKGGYFRYDHSDYVSFLTLNSLYWSIKNEMYNSSQSYEQLTWIENQFEQSEENRKFIVNMHIFPGMYNPGVRQQFFIEEFNNMFDDLMRKYGDKVIMLNGAHTHIADIRASWMEQDSVEHLLKGEATKKGYYTNFVSPSFSPYFLNNPGFTTFDLDDETHKITNIETTFLELEKTYNSTDIELVYHTVSYEKDFGIKEWSADEIQTFFKKAQNDDQFFKDYLVKKIGYRLDQSEAALAIYKNLGMIDFEDGNKKYWCFTQHIRSGDYDNCLLDK